MFEQLGLIGCGLMGGSFALALKRAGLVKRVVGYSKSPSTTQKAKQMGVIDIEAPSALLAVSGSDIVLVAVPVAATEATFKAIRHLVTKQMLVMDVGSTKTDVVEAARRALREQVGSFVPAHPIAGKEVAGIEHADADLYKGRQLILTPIERTLTTQLRQARGKAERKDPAIDDDNLLTARLDLHVPPAGFFRHEVQRLLVMFAGATRPRSVPYALRLVFDEADDADAPEPSGGLSGIPAQHAALRR